MRRNKSLFILTFCTALLIISIVLGYQLKTNKLDSRDSTDVEELPRETEDDGIEIIQEGDRITPNTFIEKRIHYKECDHTITSLDTADKDIINMDKEEYENYLKSNYPNLRLISYSNTKMVLFGERNHLCKNHFIIGERDEYLSIFKINDDGEKVIFKTFKDYPLSIFTPVDQENLKKGIVVDSEDELSDVLENFIS